MRSGEFKIIDIKEYTKDSGVSCSTFSNWSKDKPLAQKRSLDFKH